MFRVRISVKFQKCSALHHKSVHIGQQCLECDHQITQKGSLVAHYKSVHMGQQFQCHQANQKGNLVSAKKISGQHKPNHLVFGCQCYISSILYDSDKVFGFILHTIYYFKIFQGSQLLNFLVIHIILNFLTNFIPLSKIYDNPFQEVCLLSHQNPNPWITPYERKVTTEKMGKKKKKVTQNKAVIQAQYNFGQAL